MTSTGQHAECVLEKVEGSLGTELLADPGETRSVHTLTPAARRR